MPDISNTYSVINNWTEMVLCAKFPQTDNSPSLFAPRECTFVIIMRNNTRLTAFNILAPPTNRMREIIQFAPRARDFRATSRGTTYNETTGRVE